MRVFVNFSVSQLAYNKADTEIQLVSHHMLRLRLLQKKKSLLQREQTPKASIIDKRIQEQERLTYN